MQISYKPLWKLLIDKNISKTQLRESTGLSPSTFSKLVKNENVTTNTLVRVCEVLDCKIQDIVEVVINDRF